MAGIWKYVPKTVGMFDRKTGKFHPNAPVTAVRLTPPVKSRAHPDTAIRGDWYLLEMETPVGKRTYGVVNGCIDSSLRMAVKLGPGTERDEVIAKWKKAPANACPVGVLGGRGRAGGKRRRR